MHALSKIIARHADRKSVEIGEISYLRAASAAVNVRVSNPDTTHNPGPVPINAWNNVSVGGVVLRLLPRCDQEVAPTVRVSARAGPAEAKNIKAAQPTTPARRSRRP